MIRNGKLVGLEEYVYDINLYCCCILLLLIREYDNIFLSSCVPVIGFILSTLYLKVVKEIWESKIK